MIRSLQFKSLQVIFCIFLIQLSSKLISPFVKAPYVPPTFPLSPFPVVSGEQLQEYAKDVLDVIEDATLPTRPDELIAIFISEAAAGFAGGVSERVAAFLVGDSDGFETTIKGSTAGAYFGVRSAVNSVGSLLGLPVPIARLLAGIIASIAAELLKFSDRGGQDESLSSEILNDSAVSQPQQQGSRGLSIAEVVQDVTKWVAYDLILPEDIADRVPIPAAALFGALSGLIAHSVYELLKRQEGEQQKTIINRFLQAGIEGGALFASYEGSINYFETSTTPEIQKFLLKKFTDFNLFPT